MYVDLYGQTNDDKLLLVFYKTIIFMEIITKFQFLSICIQIPFSNNA